MTEAIHSDDARHDGINWRMSAALADVPRGHDDVAEVTSLEGAVRAWQALDPRHRDAATLMLDRPVVIDGVTLRLFKGEGIMALVDRLPHDATGAL